MPAQWTAVSDIAKLIAAVGFSYDPDQDIIYSRLDPPQRYFGYSLLYDDLAPVMIGAIIDCEPIYFDYQDKSWMIEFWKGQYGIETGAEIGVYWIERDERTHARVEGVEDFVPAGAHARLKKRVAKRKYTFFKCAWDQPLLEISFALYRRGRLLLKRGPEKHWWLTGFTWGVCTRPRDLAMTWTITFPDELMCAAFKAGLRRAWYLFPKGGSKTSVSLTFRRPHFFPQPGARCLLAGPVLRADAELTALYNALKSKLGLTSNDPNGFTPAAVAAAGQQAEYDQLTAHLSTTADRIERLTRLWKKQGG
jgi:hypothetical protein